MKYTFTEEDIQSIQTARQENRDKNVERRLHALELRAKGQKAEEVAKITGYNTCYISKLAAKYHNGGLEAITENHYVGNHRNMSLEEESAFLKQFVDDADDGRITDVSEIKAAYDEKVGHETGHGQIYYVLHRHGWSKKMPRSKHPKSADQEAVEASKKLTLGSRN